MIKRSRLQSSVSVSVIMVQREDVHNTSLIPGQFWRGLKIWSDGAKNTYRVKIIDTDKTTPVQGPKIKKRRQLRQVIPPTPGTFNSSEEEEENYKGAKTLLCAFCGKYKQSQKRLAFHLKHGCPKYQEVNIKREVSTFVGDSEDEENSGGRQTATL